MKNKHPECKLDCTADKAVACVVPIDRKLTLTIKEAAEYSNIGINRIDKMLREPNCPFALFVGNKKLIKRKEFELYIGGETVLR